MRYHHHRHLPVTRMAVMTETTGETGHHAEDADLRDQDPEMLESEKIHRIGPDSTSDAL